MGFAVTSCQAIHVNGKDRENTVGLRNLRLVRETVKQTDSVWGNSPRTKWKFRSHDRVARSIITKRPSLCWQIHPFPVRCPMGTQSVYWVLPCCKTEQHDGTRGDSLTTRHVTEHEKKLTMAARREVGTQRHAGTIKSTAHVSGMPDDGTTTARRRQHMMTAQHGTPMARRQHEAAAATVRHEVDDDLQQ